MPYISTLRLNQFRSYADLDLSLDGRPLILVGQNGAGKTNLLEAISLLTPGRGLRRAKLAELRRETPQTAQEIAGQGSDLKNDNSGWAVAAQIAEFGEHNPPKILHKVGVGQSPSAPGRRIVRIDGETAAGSELAKLLCIMWLTPAQDRLFTGPAAERRQFLDRLCLAHAPSHGTAALRYEKARSERNRLLSEQSHDALWYDALEADMAKFGAHMAQARAITLRALSDEINARPIGAFPKALIMLDGEAENLFESGADFDDVEDFIKQMLEQDRAIDRRAGRTLRGLHRSDLEVRHAPKNMPAARCSTGEQKALLIGLILAQARAQAQYEPILLLDEVAAHLDPLRRAALADELEDLGTQIFMTGTDRALFDAFEARAQIMTIKADDNK